MTGKQSAVLWLGLLLVVLRMFTSGQFQLFWKTVSSPSSTSGSATTTSAHSSAEAGSTGSVTLLA